MLKLLAHLRKNLEESSLKLWLMLLSPFAWELRMGARGGVGGAGLGTYLSVKKRLTP